MEYGRYKVTALTYTVKIPTGKMIRNKKGELKEQILPSRIGYIYFEIVKDINGNPIQNGMVFRFCRNRNKWSDSREQTFNTAKPGRYNDERIENEIARLTSAKFANEVVTEALLNEVEEPEEYAAMIGGRVEEFELDKEDEEGNPIISRRVVGGYLDRIAGHKEDTKKQNDWANLMKRKK